MLELEKDNLFATFEAVVNSIMAEKLDNPKNQKKLKKFKAKVNLGLEITEDFVYWVNLCAENGEFNLKRGALNDDYDLVLQAAPEDLLFFCNGENSVVHMMTKKNQFSRRKLRFKKGTTGWNIGKLLYLSKLLVLDKKKGL
jgi:hypothetical protein